MLEPAILEWVEEQNKSLILLLKDFSIDTFEKNDEEIIKEYTHKSLKLLMPRIIRIYLYNSLKVLLKLYDLIAFCFIIFLI